MRYCGQMSNMFEVHKISVAYQKTTIDKNAH